MKNFQKDSPGHPSDEMQKDSYDIQAVREYKKNGIESARRFYADDKNRKMFENHEPQVFTDTTFIYLRAYNWDAGFRPLPAGTVFWNSPDIELFDAAGNLIAANQMDIGKPYFIEVTVNNGGDLQVHHCIVELFMVDPSVGFDRANAVPLGLGSLDIAGRGSAKIRFPFIAQPSHLGHRCLFARAYSFSHDEFPANPDIFDVFNDRHNGQQNLSIVQQNQLLPFNLVNAANFGKFQLTVRQNKALDLQFLQINQLADLQFVQKLPNREFKMLPDLTDNNLFINYNLFQVGRRAPAAKRGLLNLEKPVFLKSKSRNTWEFDIEKGVQKMQVQVPELGLEKSQMAVFQIELTDNQAQKVGGITVVVIG